MEQAIRDRYHPGVLDEACRRYDIMPGSIQLLDGFESYMFAYQQGGQGRILRLGHSLRRSPDQVHGEVDWINFLAGGGVSVARALLSAQGQLVEAIDDGMGGFFLATSFERAPGGPTWDQGFWQAPALWITYGRMLGRMHALSQEYRPSNPAWRRPEWDDPSNLIATNLLATHGNGMPRKYEEVVAYLRSLPRPADAYAMIHQDAHAGNFFLDSGGRLTLFDFDDCVYGHYAYDLAMVLFYAVSNRDDADRFGQLFWTQFLVGYDQEYALDNRWLVEIPAFMKLREIELYGLILGTIPADEIASDRWTSRYMRGRAERIAADAPMITFDLRR